MKIAKSLLQHKVCLTILIPWLILYPKGLVGQDYLSGIVLDASTNKPLPYVNIGILNKGIGTVSNEEGKFLLQFSKVENQSETVQFSSIGYIAEGLFVKNLSFDSPQMIKVKMQPKIELLDGVVLTNKGKLEPFPEIIGYETDTQEKIGFWNKDLAYGGELATKILVRKGPRKLRRLSFTVVQKKADSVTVRINIYNGENILPQHKLLKENIIYTVKNTGTVNVNLEPYNIEVEDNFILSVELLEVYGTKILPLVLLASNEEGQSYRRYASLDKWQTIEKSAMAYVLDTDYYTLPKGRYKKKSTRIPSFISGYVFKSGSAVSNINVKNETTDKLVTTDDKGRYTIEADINDVLKFYGSGYPTQFKKVDDSSLNISL